MIIIIDAYNILKNLFAGKHILSRDRMSFIAKLLQYARYRHHALVVVFDGEVDESVFPKDKKNMRVLYSGANKTADQVIKDYIKRNGTVKDYLLVSSDRNLCLWADALDVPSIDSYEFYQIVLRTVDRQETGKENMRGDVVKMSLDNNELVDELMRQVAVSMVHNKDDQDEYAPSVNNKDKLSKNERKIMKIMKKL